MRVHLYYFHFFRLILCFNFRTAKFNSISVSVSLVASASPKMSSTISPLFFISDICGEKFAPQIFELLFIQLKDPTIRELSRIVLDRSINLFCLYTIEFSHREIKDDLFPSDGDDAVAHVLKPDDISFLFYHSLF